MDLSTALPRLEHLYGEAAGRPTLARIESTIAKHGLPTGRDAESRWSEDDLVLITYGDQVRQDGVAALEAQRKFLLEAGLQDSISCVHLLPFYPYTSDDGFSVVDYRAVGEETGDWDDVHRLAGDFDLMYDLVLNHCSQENEWFKKCLAGVAPYTHFFIEADPSEDLSGVTRPRSLPLLHEFETTNGSKHYWTTFSRDQVDLNFAHPDVLVEMLDVLLLYVARGAKIVRLDAIAYLWKTIGTNCIHLPETHEVVKLMRDVLDVAAPEVILLTETNVPHAENVSYFGDADEAHMVYQFSLAPLLLDAMLHQDASHLNSWLSALEAPRPGTTYFNFTASHDGVGVRPLEGLVPPQRFESLIANVRDAGAAVSMKRNADGSESPYEINATYFSLLSGDQQLEKFLSTQKVMLALQGIPGVYFQSLFAAENWTAGVAKTGRARTINRRKYDRAELDGWLADEASPRRSALDAMRTAMKIRRGRPELHPDNSQIIHAIDPARLVVIERPGDGCSFWSVTNVTGDPVDVRLPNVTSGRDLLRAVDSSEGVVVVEPFETRWIVGR